MLSGCKVLLSADARISHKSSRSKIWQRRVAQEGGTWLDAGSATAAATHLLVGDEEPAAGSAAAPVPVHYSWLEGCLAKRRRLDEADFHPAAIAAAAASSSGGGGGAGKSKGASRASPAVTSEPGRSSSAAAAAPGPAAGPSPAAVAAAAAAAASAASPGRPLLRQLAVKSPLLMASDIQHLLLHLLADAPRPHWLSVHGRPGTVVVVELPGLDRQLLLEQPPVLRQMLEGVRQRVLLQTTAVNEVASQTTAALLSVAQPGRRAGHKRKQPEPEPPGAAATSAAAAAVPAAAEGGQEPPLQHREQQDATAAEKAFPPAFFATTARQMRVMGFPHGSAEAADAAEAAVPGAAVDGSHASNCAASDQGAGQALPPGWVSTAQQRELVGDRSGAATEVVVAVDCEMVITAEGFELARVSLVGGSGARLLDALVVPDNPVLDYNTRYSGITAAMLEGLTTRCADAQRLVLRHVGPDTLLVGHTLENDLKALRLAHGRCIDSAVLYPHPRGLPHRSSLRTLAQRLLARTIQQGAHDSYIDAEVALQAVQLKWRYGPTYGTVKQGCSHLFDVLAARGRRLALAAPREMLMLHAVPQAEVVACSSDGQAVEAALRLLGGAQREQQAPARPEAAAAGPAGSAATQQQPRPSPAVQQKQQQGPDLLWLQLSELWDYLEGRATQLAGQDGALNLGQAVAAAQRDPEPRRILQQADQRLAQLAAALPAGALLLVVSGQGNTALCRALHGEGSKRK